MDDTKWFDRFAAIPGIGYVTPSGIKRPDIPKRFLTPKVDTYEWDGRRHESLSWKDGEGETSASPAQRWPPETGQRNPPPALILQRLYETLELPGVASDYHFALLSAYESLSSRARREPELYADMEKLCLLDIALVERLPMIVRDTAGAMPFRVPAFERLVTLYERNGLLDEALAIARRAAAAGQGTDLAEQIEERIAALRAEDA